jgi:UDP-GlcNAc:undecaprenyl-phosphate GlcNAc-1-phosphate transferase
MIFLSTLLISMFITMVLIPILRAAAERAGYGVDFPNPRKVHSAPIPKVGGVAMALGALVPVLFAADGGRFVNAVLIGAAIVAAFGLVDDLRGLGWKAKFAGQVIAALVVILYGQLKICFLGECLPAGVALPDLVAVPLTVLVIVGVTNAINLSDGLDGLAGGVCLLIFICIGFLSFAGEDFPDRLFTMVMCAAVTGAIFGFLRYNTFPATVFMGDTGSQLLGFLAICLSLSATQRSTPLSPFLPLLLVGFPVLDTLTVMVERIAAGRSPFAADKNHFHHKLVRLGLFHTEAVVAIYAIAALLVTAAFLLRYHSDRTLILLYLVFSALAVGGLTAAERSGFQFHRTGFFDVVIKGRLRRLKEKKLLIRSCFAPVEWGVPLLFLAAGLVPGELPGYFSFLAAGFLVANAFCWTTRREQLPAVLRMSFYLAVPLVLRMGQVDAAAWIPPALLWVYTLSFGGLALFTVLTLKFTRRQKGFKATPMDFLILLIAVVVPNLPDPLIRSASMGELAVKIIVMFFSFEVLLGELRGSTTRLTLAVLAGLALLAVRGFV